MRGYDAIVIGGGLVGSAIAYGLVRAGLKTALLDEGDVAYRAARGNFGLVWVQSKGLGAPHYQRWTRFSAEAWPSLAAELREITGIAAGRHPSLPRRRRIRRAGGNDGAAAAGGRQFRFRIPHARQKGGRRADARPRAGGDGRLLYAL